MLLFRILSFLTFVLTLGSFALAKPIATSAVERRDAEASVVNVITSLKSKAGSILPEIKNVGSDGNATYDSVGPFVSELVAALSDTKGSLSLISLISGDLSNGTTNELLPVLDTVIEELVEALGSLDGSASGSGLSELVSSVDSALSEVLLVLDIVLLGVVTLLTPLLSNFVVPLQTVGMVQTLKVLNL